MSNVGSDLKKTVTDTEAVVKSWGALAIHYLIAGGVGALAMFLFLKL